MSIEQMHLSEQIMKCVVRIEAKLPNGAIATGSGFLYKFAEKESGEHIPAIITNKHVIDGAIKISFPISTLDVNGNLTGTFETCTYDLNPLENDLIIHHPDKEVDLCAILATPLYQYFENKNEQPFLLGLNKKVTASASSFFDIYPLQPVAMIGFPSGIWDSVNNGAIARRGVIATVPKDDYLGKKQFVVDMACFPGSSGSPVFLADFGSFPVKGGISMGERVELLGILYAGPQHTASGEIVLVPIPTQNKPISLTSIPNNLGYVIKATELEEIEKVIYNMLA